MFFDWDCRLLYRVFMYILIRNVRKYLSLFLKIVANDNVFVEISKSFALFCHFNIFVILGEKRMSYFLFDNLGTVPPRLSSIKLTTVVTIPNAVKLM